MHCQMHAFSRDLSARLSVIGDRGRHKHRGGYKQPPHRSVRQAQHGDYNDIVRVETLMAHIQCSRDSNHEITNHVAHNHNWTLDM